MNDIAVTDGLITILIILIFVLPVLFAYMVWDSKDKKRREQAKKMLKRRKREFAEECERAGRRLINEDKNKSLMNENVKKKVKPLNIQDCLVVKMHLKIERRKEKCISVEIVV